MMPGPSSRRSHIGRGALAATAALFTALILPALPATAASAAPAAPAAQAAWTPRAFTCSGTLADLGTFTVTGLLPGNNVPYHLTVTHGAAVLSSHPGKAIALGDSPIHAGYRQWDITGAGANGDLYYLDIPPVLPGQGGYFDADLEVLYNGGLDGANQIPMFDCTVTGGPPSLSTPPGPRSFTCSGNDAEVARTVTGSLNRQNNPYAVTVTQTGTTVVFSRRLARAALLGPSPLHSGYVEWDITGPAAHGDLYHLSTPPVLPPPGGFFDADLQILFNGGQNGNIQIPLFDCTVG